WRGEFVDVDGASLNGGMLTLRRPMHAQEQEVQLSKAVSASVEDARDKGRGGCGGHMFGYLVGFEGRGQRGGPATVREAVRRPVDQCETILTSMELDGLCPEEQRTVYSNAFADTMSEMVTKHPEFDHDLRLAIGEDYMAQLKEATSDPGAFLHEQWTKPRPFRAGPTASDRTQQEQWGAAGPPGGQAHYRPAWSSTAGHRERPRGEEEQHVRDEQRPGREGTGEVRFEVRPDVWLHQARGPGPVVAAACGEPEEGQHH